MRLRIFELGQVFPQDDELANAMFRLCSLREDLGFEMLALTADELEPLDSYDTLVRRIYFIRRNCISLASLEDSLRDPALNKYIGSRKAAGDEDGWIGGAIEKRKVFLQRMENIRTIRNKIAAHLDTDRAAAVLKHFSWLKGPVQIDRKVVNVSWKLVAQATTFGLLDGAADQNDIDAKVPAVATPIKEAHEAALMTVDQLMFDYMKQRGLWGA